MRFRTPICPSCKGRAIGTADIIQATTFIIRNPDGSYDYEGSMDINLDTQKNLSVQPGFITLECGACHEIWETRILDEEAVR